MPTLKFHALASVDSDSGRRLSIGSFDGLPFHCLADTLGDDIVAAVDDGAVEDNCVQNNPYLLFRCEAFCLRILDSVGDRRR